MTWGRARSGGADPTTRKRVKGQVGKNFCRPEILADRSRLTPMARKRRRCEHNKSSPFAGGIGQPVAFQAAGEAAK